MANKWQEIQGLEEELEERRKQFSYLRQRRVKAVRLWWKVTKKGLWISNGSYQVLMDKDQLELERLRQQLSDGHGSISDWVKDSNDEIGFDVRNIVSDCWKCKKFSMVYLGSRSPGPEVAVKMMTCVACGANGDDVVD